MSRWYETDPVDESFFTSAPHRFSFDLDVPVPAARVWESLQSDPSLSAWGPGVRRVEWTSPRPFGVGTTRVVTVALGAAAFRERFFVWDEGRRYSFCLTAATRPLVRSLAEDYVVTDRPGGARLTWTVAFAGGPRMQRLMPALAPLTRLGFGLLARDGVRYFRKQA